MHKIMLSKLSSEKSIDAGLAAIREKIKEGDLNEALKGVQHVVNYVLQSHFAPPVFFLRLNWTICVRKLVLPLWRVLSLRKIYP